MEQFFQTRNPWVWALSSGMIEEGSLAAMSTKIQAPLWAVEAEAKALRWDCNSQRVLAGLASPPTSVDAVITGMQVSCAEFRLVVFFLMSNA